MSHADYLALCDEDQLVRLVEMANDKLRQIRQAGWVKLWVVCDDSLNLAWFEQKDYALALEFLAETGKAALANNAACELEVRLEKLRPAEAAKVVKETLAELARKSRTRPTASRVSPT